jgi:hypothetical protein
MARYKVYAGCVNGSNELVIATRSKRAARARLRVSASLFNHSFRETTLEEYTEAALANPDVPLQRRLSAVEGDPFEQIEVD